MPSVIPKILAALSEEVMTQLDLAKALGHPGEGGRARENVLAAFLRRLIPDTYGVSTGFVIDASGSTSRQIDLIIYRNDYHPIFEVGEIKHFMVESVAMVIENKSRIHTKAALTQALDNIKSVKVLDRTNGGKNYLMHGGLPGVAVNPDNFQHQVFGAILTEQSLSKKAFTAEMLSFLHSNDRRHWPNMYVDVGHFAMAYLDSIEPAVITAIPQTAKYIAVTNDQVPNYIPSLIELAHEVVNFLRICPVVDFKPTDYILSQAGTINWTEI